MSEVEQSYFEQRAEAELQLAQRAIHPAAVKAHYELAGHYLNRLYSDNRNENASDAVDDRVIPDARSCG